MQLLLLADGDGFEPLHHRHAHACVVGRGDDEQSVAQRGEAFGLRAAAFVALGGGVEQLRQFGRTNGALGLVGSGAKADRKSTRLNSSHSS